MQWENLQEVNPQIHVLRLKETIKQEVGENGLPVRFNLRPNNVFFFFFFFHIDFFKAWNCWFQNFFITDTGSEIKKLNLWVCPTEFPPQWTTLISGINK
jgi:hypothetical protein